MILDTETTGICKFKTVLNFQLELWPYIVQLSYILYDTEKETIQIKDDIIKIPDNVLISEENASIHGITKQISSENGVPLFESLLDFAKHYQECDLLVGHNLSFDINMLIAELIRVIDNRASAVKYLVDYSKLLNSLMKPVKDKYFCTMKNSIDFCNIKSVNKKGDEFVKFPSLAELHARLFDTVPKNLHNSLNDVIVCFRCYYMLKHQLDILETNYEMKKMYQTLL